MNKSRMFSPRDEESLQHCFCGSNGDYCAQLFVISVVLQGLHVQDQLNDANTLILWYTVILFCFKSCFWRVSNHWDAVWHYHHAAHHHL